MCAVVGPARDRSQIALGYKWHTSGAHHVLPGPHGLVSIDVRSSWSQPLAPLPPPVQAPPRSAGPVAPDSCPGCARGCCCRPLWLSASVLGSAPESLFPCFHTAWASPPVVCFRSSGMYYVGDVSIYTSRSTSTRIADRWTGIVSQHACGTSGWLYWSGSQHTYGTGGAHYTGAGNSMRTLYPSGRAIDT